MLNRPLDAGENVHHVNGDRLDDRPANLKLWSVAQPKGQRVRDELQFAQEIVQRHDPEQQRSWGCPENHSDPVTSSHRVGLRTPERIRTAATAVRGRRPRPLDDGGLERAGWS